MSGAYKYRPQYTQNTIGPSVGEAPQRRIGVYDYASAIDCLKANWEQVFPNEPFRDPQDAIQMMAATIMQLRREAKGLKP